MNSTSLSNSVSFDLKDLGQITDLLGVTTWSGTEICAAVQSRSEDLIKAGVGERSNAVIAHGGTPEFFVDLFAVWSLGACASCTNADLTDKELQNVAEFTQANVVLLGTRPSLDVAFPGVACIEGLCPRPTASPTASSLVIDNPGDLPALILFTSGTTGTPKGVVHSFATLAARVKANHEQIPKETMERTLCVLPTHFGHGLIGNCLTPLLAGADLYLAAGGGLLSAAKLGIFLSENQITFMSSVPAFWKLALKASKQPETKSLKQVNIGSAPVAAELIESIADWTGTQDIRNMYGITETANWVAGSSARDMSPEDGLVGKMWGGEAAVAGSDGSIKPTGFGEILLKPPSLMVGYLKQPELTAEVLRDGWYYTGDTGTIDEDGVIRLSGRIKNEINRGGMKVAPEEIDLLLERRLDVLEACAFGLPDEIAGEIVAAAIVVAPDMEIDLKELRSWCITQIRRECVPERWFILPVIPKTDRGKLNRDNVRQACLHMEKT
jgi:acyl-CoA synthetase (AMP-forming)/AMP-acid ligase II